VARETLPLASAVTPSCLSPCGSRFRRAIARTRRWHAVLRRSSDQESKKEELRIFDPVTHARTVCKVATRQCTVTGYCARISFRPTPAGSLDDEKRYLTPESVGSDVIDGFNVVGTHETTTINAGMVGNSQPLVTTREFWYFPELQVNLSVTRRDPREGTQVIHLVDLSRTEPDPAMFQVPAGFVVEDSRKSAKAEN
jgi:hypothetical protein